VEKCLIFGDFYKIVDDDDDLHHFLSSIIIIYSFIVLLIPREDFLFGPVISGNGQFPIWT